MSGRKPNVSPATVIDAVMKYMDRVVETDADGEKKIVVATDTVWSDISIYLNGLMSKSAIHTFVYKGRHEIKEKLGFCSSTKIDPPAETILDSSTEDGSSDENSSTNLDFSKRKFVVTFSSEEWKQIKPHDVQYRLNDKKRPTQSFKTYYALTKNQWTPILAEHFWVHTQLPCCLSFRKANVHPHGTNFVTVFGRCSVCSSCFKGIISEKPLDDERVLMHCTYTGHFDMLHDSNKKRRLLGTAKEKVITAIVDKNISSVTHREKEAVRLMKTGYSEPPIIPTGGALRQTKWRHLASNRRHEDIFTSLAIMKNENEYKDILHDLSFEPFYIQYHSSEQIHLYRSYCQSTSYPKIIIDATGSLIKNFKKLGMNKTKTIYLYEALVYDESKLHSFTVSNMISERHTTLAIYNWLANWLNFNVPSPKETVCDQSMALLSACVKCFTQYSSLKQYIIVCAQLAFRKISSESIWLPNCFIRTDVAHFIKLVSKWVPLKTTHGRVREVILRTIGVIIKTQSMSEIYSIILSLFVVVTNESDGVDVVTGRDTPCEHHKKKLIEITSTGFFNYEEWYNEVLSSVDSEEDILDLMEEVYEPQCNDLDDEKNPFQSWAEEIFKKSKEFIREGNGINAMYLPTLVPLVIKCIHFLPLWSGLMIPIFKYGHSTASSAGVESSFKKLKVITFKDIDLPTNIDLFLERHIISLRGNSLLRFASINTHNIIQSVNDRETLPLHQTNNLMLEDGSHLQETLPLIQTNELMLEEDDYIAIDENNINDILNTENEIPVSSKSIVINNNNCEENNAKEGWDRKSKKQSIKNSYLNPNSHLRHINLNNSRSIASLPNLKNGSKVTDLKSRNIKGFGKVALSNTCAFDALASIFMVSYCTSKQYSKEMNCLENSNEFLSFVSSIVKKGINPTTYKERAKILLNYLKPETINIDYDVTLVSCHATAAFVVQKLFTQIPTALDYMLCSNTKCEYATEIKKSVTYLTFHTQKNLDGLQNFLSERLSMDYLTCGHINAYETNPCNGNKTIRSEASTIHLIIEILKWEGDNANYQNHSTDAAPQLQIQLSEIPQVLIYNNTTYELRGVCDYRKGLSRLRTSVGHYVAYCKRGPRNWELYDDTNKKSKPVNQNTQVMCELIVYTV